MLNVYGASDDLIEIEGDISEEFYAKAMGEEDRQDGATLCFSEGTLLDIVYKNTGLWKVTINRAGTAEPKITFSATDPDGDHYSDIVEFSGEIHWEASASVDLAVRK